MNKAKTTQKLALNENADKSAAFLADLQNHYLPAVSAIFNSIKELGIVNPSRSLLFSTIQGDFGPLEQAYDEVTRSDVESFKSQAAKDQMLSIFQGKLDSIRDQVNVLFSDMIGTVTTTYETGTTFDSFEALATSQGKFGKISMTSQSLVKFVALNDAGVLVIPDEAKESIIDAFIEYADATKQMIYDLQQKAAKALGEFAGALSDAGIKHDLEIVPQVFMRRFFNLDRSEDGTYAITERVEGIR
jgi:hypothetical protein